jgi:hypothetical protein
LVSVLHGHTQSATSGIHMNRVQPS